MVKKSTVYLLAIFALLGVFAWWFEFSPTSEARKTTPTVTEISRPFANWKFENTQLIDYKSPDGTALTIRMGKDINSWSIDQNNGASADTGKVFQLMSELLTVKPLTKLEAVSDEAAMGLGEKSRKLKLEDSTGASIDIQLGSETATKSGTYIKVGADYYIINTPVIQNLDLLLTKEGLLSPTELPPPATATLQP
ncbi:MAG: DUF4340 domain-containing protein [Leptolinea sp.]